VVELVLSLNANDANEVNEEYNFHGILVYFVCIVFFVFLMRAFILAGGFATRLWPLTEKRAKPLLPLAGKPIITHLVEKIPAGMPVTVSTNAAFADGFKRWLDPSLRLGQVPMRNIELVIEPTLRDNQKLGALGSIAQWIESEKIDEDLLILTGDNYLGFSMETFLAAFHGNPLLAAHDIGDLERAKVFGTVVPEIASSPSPSPTLSAVEGSAVEGSDLSHEALRSRAKWEGRRGGGDGGVGVSKRVAAFEEKPSKPKSTLVSTGCVILPKSTLPILIEFARRKPDNLGGIFEELLRRNFPVECFTFLEPWMDIGSFHSYLDAHKALIGQSTLIDPSATVRGTQLRGSVTVGKNCVIEGSELTDCMVFDNAQIRDCTFKNCVIDEECVLEGIDLQKQMLRRGTRLIVK